MKLTQKDLDRIAAQADYQILADSGNAPVDMRMTDDHRRMLGKERPVQNGILRIVLKGERPTSLNQWYSGKHWTVRKREADRVHALVREQLVDCKMYNVPVNIRITAYFASRPQDASNIVSKIYEDGLVGHVLVDDGPKYVASMTTESRIDKKNPRVEIEVKPA